MVPANNIEIGAGKESRVRSVAFMVAAALLAAPASLVRGEDAAGRSAYLALLRDGLFDAARARADVPAPRAEDLFFAAFTTYWRLVFDDENPELQSVLESQLDAAVAAADAEDHAAKGESAASLWSGSSHLLLAQLRASERRPLAAAFEAKKAKKLLEVAARRGADTSDALFGLGTYNYMADTVPSYVKGLRALLFLPAGNRDRGLAQLERAAAESRYFAFEARVLLVTIYANRHERLYDRAIHQKDLLLRQSPDSIASLYAAARLDLSLGRNDSAVALLSRAAARAHGLTGVDPVVLRSIDLLLARAEFARIRPDLTSATTRAALATGSGLSPSIRKDLEELQAASERLASGIDWANTAPKDDSVSEAERWAALAKERPERPILALLAGDASLRAGKPDEALVWLNRASTSTLPPALRAGCELRQGQASDLLGRRPQALDFYRRAADTPGFVAKDAAVYYQQTPYRIGT